MVDSTPDKSSSGVTVGDVGGNIDHALIAGRDIIGNLLVTGDHNQVFVGGYERLTEAYIKPQEVFDRVDLEHFTGREWLRDAVDAFLQKYDHGYFILEADAGLGKTTFMAWLVKQRNYVHHFSELAPGPEGVEPALMSLAAQLALAYNLKPEGVLPAAASLPDYLYDLLVQAAQQRRPGEKVVLVVDALDQASTPLNQNVLRLPTSLPIGVYVIVSQRPVPVTLQIKASHTPRVPYLLTAESNGNQSDMRQFLERTAARPGIAEGILTDGYTPEQFVATLLGKSRGLWIYVHYVVAQLELDAKGSGTQHLDLRLDRLPDGLTQYYIHYWQAWRDADEDKWYSIYLPLLATLAAAKEAVTLDRLLAWAGVPAAPPGLVRLFSERWRPFMFISGQGQSARYRFYHATLPEFFAGQSDLTSLTTAERSLVAELAETTRAAHDRLAERYLRAWGGLEGGLLGLQQASMRDLDDRYGLRYLPNHLASANRLGDLHHLLRIEWLRGSTGLCTSEGQSAADQSMRAENLGHSAGYQNAWYTVLESLGQTDSYLSAVMEAWRWADVPLAEPSWSHAPNSLAAIGTRPNAVSLQCRYALIVASLNSLANNILPGLLKEIVQKGVWLPQQALVFAHQVPDVRRRTESLATVALYLSAGEQELVLQEALCTAQGIEDSGSRAWALADLASRMAEQGQMQDALRTAQGIEHSSACAQTLAGLASYFSAGEQEQVLQEALRITQGIEDSDSRAQALADLAPYLSASEQEQVLQEALRIAQGIEDSDSCAQVLADLAPYLSAAQLQEALRIAQSIDDSDSCAQVLADLAPYLSAAQMQEALRTAQDIEESFFRAWALADLAPYLSAAQLQEALRIAQGIEDSFARIPAMAGLASRMAELGQVQEALRIAQGIEDNSFRAQAVATVAPYLSAGEQEQVLQEALCTAPGIEDSDSRAQAVAGLAPYLSAAQMQEALRIAQGIEDSNSRARALADLASRMAELGQVQEALRIAQSIEDSSARAQALADLAPYLSAVQLQDALRTAQGIDDSDSCAQVLADLAPYLSASEQEQVLRESLRIVQVIERSDSRARALADLASRMAKLGQVQEALRTARGIQDNFFRAWAVAGLAPYLSAAQMQEALRIAQGIEDSDSRAQALADLASRMAELGQVQEALRIAQSIEATFFRAQALATVAPYLSARDQGQVLQEALHIAQGIEDSDSRARALADLASRMAKLGQVQEALRIAQSFDDNFSRAWAVAGLAPYLSAAQMQEALRIAQGIEDSDSRAQALADLASRMAELGQVQEALRIAQSIEATFFRAQALATVAPYLSARDQGQVLQEALHIAQGIEDSDSRARALADLASRMAKLGQVQEALRIAQSIEDSSARIQTLIWLASYLADLGQMQDALRAAKSIEHSQLRAQAMAGLTSRMADLGELQEALHIARDIEASYVRAWALAGLAPHLVQLSPEYLHPAWRELLPVLASRSRSDLLADFSVLAAVIFHLGGSSAIEATIQAIQDVGRWWP